MARGKIIINYFSTSCKFDTVDLMDDDKLYDALNIKVNVLHVGVPKGKHGFNHETLSKNLMVSPDTANKTVQCNTQLGIRTVLQPSLSRSFRDNYQELWYWRLHHGVFTNTMKARTILRRINQYDQVYTTVFHWCGSHPMKAKIDARDYLSLLFHRGAVPPNMIVDVSKEHTLVKLKKKCQ